MIKLASGSDSLLIDFLVERNVRGLVLEAFGRGNVPPAALPGIRRAVEKGIPVVITTRTIAGRVLDVYGYEGGAKTVLEAGGILGGETSGPKARLSLCWPLAWRRAVTSWRSFSIRRDRFHEKRQTGKLKMARAIPRHLFFAARIGKKTGRNGPESLTRGPPGWKKPRIFPGPPGLWAFSLLRLLLHYPRPDEKRDPGEPRNLPCRTSAGCRGAFS